MTRDEAHKLLTALCQEYAASAINGLVIHRSGYLNMLKQEFLDRLFPAKLPADTAKKVLEILNKDRDEDKFFSAHLVIERGKHIINTVNRGSSDYGFIYEVFVDKKLYATFENSEELFVSCLIDLFTQIDEGVFVHHKEDGE